jgi:outer membrane protein assembly factor BamB
VAVGACAALADFDGPAPVAWRWAQSTSASPAGAPIVMGNTVFAAVGGRIYALDKATGNQVWRFPLAEPLATNFRTGAAMGNGFIVAADDNRTLYAVDTTTGVLKWQTTSDATLSGPPVVVGNHVVFGTMPSGLMSVDAATGKPEWKEPVKLAANPYPTMAVWQDTVIVLTNEPSVLGFSMSTNKVTWSVKASQLSGLSVPTVYGDNVYVNTGNYLTALRCSNGGKRWDARLDQNLAFGPAASDSGVAVVTTAGILYSFDTMGKFMFKTGVDLDSSPVATPSYVGKLVAVGTENGSLNVVDPRSGEVVFNYIIPPLFRGAKISGGGTSTEEEVKYTTVSGPAIASGDTMLVLARDGSLLAFDKNLGVDLTAPKVKMTWPNPGDQVSGQPPMELWFKIEDAASGVNANTVQVKIGGNAYTGSYTKDGFLCVRISAIGGNRPLMDGRAEIVISASDWLGNKVEAPFVLSIDNTIAPLGAPPAKDAATTGGRAGGAKGGKQGGGAGG